MHASWIVVGVVLIPIAGLLLRFNEGIARWQIDTRVESIRRLRMQNADYEQRQIESIKSPGSLQLQRVMVVVFGVALAGGGIWCVVRGLGFGA